MADQFEEMKRSLLSMYEQKIAEYQGLVDGLRRDLGEGLAEQPAHKNDVVPPASRMANLDINELVRPGDFFGMTQVQAMQEFLQRTNRTPASLQELAQAMFRGKATDALIEGPDKLRNLSSLLSKTDIFLSVARGRWGLSEWYPNKQKVKRGNKESKPDADKKDAEAVASA